MYTIDNLPESINIGKQGESGILTLEFDCSAWVSKFPDGLISAVYIDPRTNAIAPIPLSQAYKTGSTFYIKVLHNLTVYAGYAYINIRLVGGSDIEKRTAMIKVYVEKGVTPSADMPGMVQDWINDATSKLAEVDHFVDDTIAATEAANEAAVRAENGEDERENAEGLRVIAEQGRHDAYELAEAARDGLYDAAESGRDGLFNASQTERTNAYNLRENQRDDAYAAAELIREGAETARETAEGLRDEAEGLRGSAETSRNTAEGLRDSAETARREAEVLRIAAEAARMGFKPMGAYNPANENKYGEWYTHEGGSYGYIYPTPSTGVPLTDTSHWQQIAEKGDKGDTGTTAFEMAQAGGYSRGESDFYEDLARLDNTPPETWAEIQARVRDGTIDRYLMVGDQLIVPHATYGDIVFDIAAISTSADAAMAPGAAGYFTSFPNAKPLTLLTRNCLANVQFSAPQANYKVLAAIPAGAANITLTSSAVASGVATQYDLTVPVGGFAINSLLRISSATNLQYYATPTSAVVNVAISAGTANTPLVVSPTAGAVLSAENHKDRVAYGSNNYSQSAIRQWLGSALAKGTYWTPQSIYDLPPSWNSTLDGFLKGLDADFLSVIGTTSRVTANNTVTDGGGSYTLTDRFFLPSRTEVGLGNEITGGENAAWPLFTSNAGRIKYLAGAARTWWLRSPYATNATIVRGVNAGGALNSYDYAYYAIGAAAACVIL